LPLVAVLLSASFVAAEERAQPLPNTTFDTPVEGLRVVSHQGTLRGSTTYDIDAEADLANATVNGTESLQLMEKMVWCVCSSSIVDVKCGGMHYTLMQCNPLCPAACRRKGLAFKSCTGARQVGWYKRLHYKWSDCADSPLVGGA